MKNAVLRIIPIVLIGYGCFVAGRIFTVREAADPETFESVTLAAKEALDNKNYAAAVRQYQRALALRPGDAALHGSLGLALAQGGRTQDAINEFEKCLVLDPDRFDIAKELGKALYKFERFNEAKERFESVVQHRPKDAEAFEWLFTINNRVGQQLDNLPVLERLADLRPDDTQYQYSKIMVYHQNDLFEDALKAFEELPADERETGKARYLLAAIHFQHEDYAKAIELLEQLVSDEPEHAEAQNLLEDARMRSEQARKFALELKGLNEAIEANPDDPEARFRLGYALTKANRPDEATTAFQEALARLAPEDVDTAKQLAQILYKLERFDMAEQVLELVAEEAKDQEIYEILLGINARRNNPLENIPILQKLVELNPEDSKYVTYQLGIFLENGQPEKALQALKKLPEEQQTEIKNKYILGVIYYQLKERAKAAEVLEEVVRRSPDNEDAKKILEQIRARPGQ